MNLIVDIGNTRVKLAVTRDGEIVEEAAAETLASTRIDALLSAWPGVERAIVCSTRGDGAAAAELVRRRVAQTIEFTAATPVPIGVAYATPATLGRDRLAAAVGAATLFPGRNVLVADFGTALTVDLVTADGTFRGGAISPGMRTRFRALHDYTASLPLVGPTDDGRLSGDTTESAVALGVMNGMTFEIEGYIREMSEIFGDLCVIFTGGDAKHFVKRIKNTIFANWNLVVCGLDRILEYNASEENHY